jgi:hypothetical protein
MLPPHQLVVARRVLTNDLDCIGLFTADIAFSLFR